MEPRARADLWVEAHIRRCWVSDVPAVLVRRGDDTAGAVLIKLNCFEAGCTVFSAATSLDGGRIWLRGTGDDPVPEADADAYIARHIARDPDVWVVEIEDREGRHFLDDPIE